MRVLDEISAPVDVGDIPLRVPDEPQIPTVLFSHELSIRLKFLNAQIELLKLTAAEVSGTADVQEHVVVVEGHVRYDFLFVNSARPRAVSCKRSCSHKAAETSLEYAEIGG